MLQTMGYLIWIITKMLKIKMKKKKKNIHNLNAEMLFLWSLLHII